MYLYTTKASTTRRRQSPTKPIEGSSSTDKNAHQQKASWKKIETKSPSWNLHRTDDINSATRRVPLFIVLSIILCLSFIFATIIQCDRNTSGEKIIPVSKEKSFEFVKSFANAPPSCKQMIDYKDIDYTLVTHSSEDRLWMMEHHCLRWGHYNPISIAIFTARFTSSW